MIEKLDLLPKCPYSSSAEYRPPAKLIPISPTEKALVDDYYLKTGLWAGAVFCISATGKVIFYLRRFSTLILKNI